MNNFPNNQSKEFPMLIVLENTNVCNLRCIHCPIGQGWTETEHYKPTYLKWEIFKKIIDEISENHITQLIFSPEGENFVHPQFIDQLNYCKEKGIENITVITNGFNLDNKAIIKGKKSDLTNNKALLKANPEVINISLDAATKETYEKIRVGSNFHRVWGNIHNLIYLRNQMNSKTKIMLNIIEQKENNDEVELFLKYWSPYVDRVLVRPYLNNLGLTPNKKEINKSIIDNRWGCPQFWKRISINAKGDIRFCVVDWDDKSIVGNIKFQKIKEIWQGPEYERMRSCHKHGKYKEAHDICDKCTDWTGMRWDWGYEKALTALRGDENIPDLPTPLD